NVIPDAIECKPLLLVARERRRAAVEVTFDAEQLVVVFGLEVIRNRPEELACPLIVLVCPRISEPVSLSRLHGSHAFFQPLHLLELEFLEAALGFVLGCRIFGEFQNGIADLLTRTCNAAAEPLHGTGRSGGVDRSNGATGARRGHAAEIVPAR